MLLCFSVLYISCSEDDFRREHEHEHMAESGLFQKKTISYEELRSRLKDKPVSLLSGISNKGGESYIESIDSTTVVEINMGALTTYTLKVNTIDDGDYYLSNLIIKEEGDSILEVIVHYLPTADWIAAFENHERIEYDGEIRVVDTEGNDLSEGGVSGKMYCTYSVYTSSYCTCEGHPEGSPDCTCTTFENGYSITLNCGYSGGGSGGWSDDDDGGSGGGGIPTDPIPGEGETPCQSLALKTDADFHHKINFLKTKVDENPNEWGWENYNYPTAGNGTNIYNVSAEGTTKKYTLREWGSHVFGYAHSHPDDDDEVMGVHSTADIRIFTDIVRFRAENGYSTSEAYGIVVGEHGTYALKLEDISKFNNWRLEYDTGTKIGKYFVEFERDYKKIRTHENNQINNERSVLNILDQYYNDIGVGIYRAVESGNTITGWERMTLDANRNPKRTNCNNL